MPWLFEELKSQAIGHLTAGISISGNEKHKRLAECDFPKRRSLPKISSSAKPIHNCPLNSGHATNSVKNGSFWYHHRFHLIACWFDVVTIYSRHFVCGVRWDLYDLDVITLRLKKEKCRIFLGTLIPSLYFCNTSSFPCLQAYQTRSPLFLLTMLDGLPRN